MNLIAAACVSSVSISEMLLLLERKVLRPTIVSQKPATLKATHIYF